jgi:hypothetical protein
VKLLRLNAVAFLPCGCAAACGVVAAACASTRDVAVAGGVHLLKIASWHKLPQLMLLRLRLPDLDVAACGVHLLKIASYHKLPRLMPPLLQLCFVRAAALRSTLVAALRSTRAACGVHLLRIASYHKLPRLMLPLLRLHLVLQYHLSTARGVLRIVPQPHVRNVLHSLRPASGVLRVILQLHVRSMLHSLRTASGVLRAVLQLHVRNVLPSLHRVSTYRWHTREWRTRVVCRIVHATSRLHSCCRVMQLHVRHVLG